MDHETFLCQLPDWYTQEDRQLIASVDQRCSVRYSRAIALLCLQYQYDDPEIIVAALLYHRNTDILVPSCVFLALTGRQAWFSIPTPFLREVPEIARERVNAYHMRTRQLAAKFRIIKLFHALVQLRIAGTFTLPRLRDCLKDARRRVLPLARETEPVIALLILAETERLEALVAACVEEGITP